MASGSCPNPAVVHHRAAAPRRRAESPRRRAEWSRRRAESPCRRSPPPRAATPCRRTPSRRAAKPSRRAGSIGFDSYFVGPGADFDIDMTKPLTVVHHGRQHRRGRDGIDEGDLSEINRRFNSGKMIGVVSFDGTIELEAAAAAAPAITPPPQRTLALC